MSLIVLQLEFAGAVIAGQIQTLPLFEHYENTLIKKLSIMIQPIALLCCV
ncbi:hypothetical protein [Legionella gresilensis]|nr:hypothetical protein [Legionella gresilensis]